MEQTEEGYKAELKDFDYALPRELIAQKPVVPRDSSRLLVIHISKDWQDNIHDKTGAKKKVPVLEHKHFYDIIDYLQRDDVLVLNNTRVLPNKIYGKKETGGKASIIIEGIVEDAKPDDAKPDDAGPGGILPGLKDAFANGGRPYNLYKCRVESNNPKPGNRLLFEHGLSAEITGQEKDFFFLRFNEPDIESYLKRYGKLPTPSYVRKILEDDSGYQTEFAEKDGSLAAPTSGLHFTKDIIKRAEEKGVMIVYVTLHISFATFARVDEKKPLSEHRMGPEQYEITKEAADAINNRKGRLVVCGTTAFKTLESAAEIVQEEREGELQEKTVLIPKSGVSELFIYPGYKFKVNPDLMITNFHLPKSTLILLVSAYFGRENIMFAYKEAVKERYRFLSLGDSTLFIRE